jgi:hypothetical protein
VQIETLPVTHFQTPPELLRRQVIKYDRTSVLMPLLSSFSTQEEGRSLVEFDLAGIENALATELLSKAQLINLHVRQFTYLGELRETGRLSALAVHVPQEELPEVIKETVMKELDTPERTTRLVTLLEDCINFLARLGGGHIGGVDGAMLLKQYMLEVLMIDAAVWKAAAIPVLDQQVKLSQLRSLFLAIEGMSGGLEQRVENKYREALPAELLCDLEAGAQWVDLAFLLPVLRDFLSDHLSNSSLGAAVPLKLCLESQEAMLDELDWFKHVPDGLELRHAWSTFVTYNQMLGG